MRIFLMQPQKASSCSCTECPSDVTRPYVGSSAQSAALTLHRKEEKSLLLGRGPTFICACCSTHGMGADLFLSLHQVTRYRCCHAHCWIYTKPSGFLIFLIHTSVKILKRLRNYHSNFPWFTKKEQKIWLVSWLNHHHFYKVSRAGQNFWVSNSKYNIEFGPDNDCVPI